MNKFLLTIILFSVISSCKKDEIQEHHKVIEFAVFNLFRNHDFQPVYLGNDHYLSYCKKFGIFNDTLETNDTLVQIALTNDDMEILNGFLPIRDLKYIEINEVDHLFENKSRYKSVLVISDFYKEKYGYYYIQVSLIFGKRGVISRSMKIKEDHGIFFVMEYQEH